MSMRSRLSLTANSRAQPQSEPLPSRRKRPSLFPKLVEEELRSYYRARSTRVGQSFKAGLPRGSGMQTQVQSAPVCTNWYVRWRMRNRLLMACVMSVAVLTICGPLLAHHGTPAYED